jgi:tRNA threonylcarbamoyl adenosine modification protein (Sua5/YciO/YrdC/YwlC family)
MGEILNIHPVDPQPRLLQRAADALRDGALIVYPTDSSYALGCHIGNKPALDRIRRIRGVERDHDFTLVCRDLSEIGVYARVDNWAYRLLRSLTPGPYTFVLQASREVPRRLQDPKRRSIGIRVPDNRVARGLLEALGAPLMSSTLLLPGDELPLADPADVEERVRQLVDMILDAGPCGVEPTTILDFSKGQVEVVRRGKGDISALID